MKLDSVIKLHTDDEINGYVFGNWKTDLFRDSHASGGFVASVVRPFATMPCFFFRASDERLEKAHFSTWWRGMQIRDYDNDHVHDLYWLHEMFHAGDMSFRRGLSHEAFERKMQDNELSASVCSEIEAYFRLPGLREHTFSEGIFADRFLQDPDLQSRWAIDPDRVVRELRVARQNAMMAEPPQDHSDPSVFWIKQYQHQNRSWASIWVHQFDKVESAMVRMRESVMRGSRAQALDDHLDFLMSREIALGGDIPFPLEADAFAGIYWLNKQMYNLYHSTPAQVAALAPAIPPAPAV